MCQQKHYIIAISNRITHPDFFLIITCNPNRPGTIKALVPSQLLQGKPDVAARVFMTKFRAMTSYLIEAKLFGNIAAYVRVMVFQNHGFPHIMCIACYS